MSLAGGATSIRTRRGFIGGIAAAGAAGAAAGPLWNAIASDAPAECEAEPAGTATNAIAVGAGRTAWTADERGTTIVAHRGRDLARGESIDVGGAPVDIAISPNGLQALVATASYDRPGLAVVDLRGGLSRLEVGPEPRAVAFAPDGRAAYVVGGGARGTLTRVDPRSGRVHAPVAVGAHARDAAILPGGEHALVTLNAESAVAVVELASGRVARRIATSPFPHRIDVSRDGRHALVTHNGFGDRHVTPIDTRRLRAGAPIEVGLDPTAVAFGASGARALVATAGDGAVALVDARAGRRRRRAKVGVAPRAVAATRSRWVVADGATGRVKGLALGALR